MDEDVICWEEKEFMLWGTSRVVIFLWWHWFRKSMMKYKITISVWYFNLNIKINLIRGKSKGSFLSQQIIYLFDCTHRKLVTFLAVGFRISPLFLSIIVANWVLMSSGTFWSWYISFKTYYHDTMFARSNFPKTACYILY